MPGLSEGFAGAVVGTSAGLAVGYKWLDGLVVNQNLQGAILLGSGFVGGAVSAVTAYRLKLRHRGASTLKHELRQLVQTGEMSRDIQPEVVTTLATQSNGKLKYAELIEQYGGESAKAALLEYARNLAK